MAAAAASRLTWIPTSRAEARLDAYRLVEAVQAGDIADAVTVQLARAESQGWDEVVRVLLFARFVESYMVDLPSVDDDLAVLIKRCESDQDPVILALALAARARRRLHSGSVLAQQEGDRDLARATAILETATGGALELVTALVACAVNYVARDMWEIAEELFTRAVELLPECEIPQREPIIRENQMNGLVELGCAYREMDLTAQLRGIRGAGDEAIMTALDSDAPAAWLVDVRAARHLWSALHCREPSESSADLEVALAASDTPRPEEALLLLRVAQALRALEEEDWSGTARFVDLAVGLFRDDMPSPVRALTLFLGAQAESGLNGAGAGCSRALRYAEFSAQQRWNARIRALALARAGMTTERLRIERDQHAHRSLKDELTGIANRRGYTNYLDALSRSAQASLLTMMIVDVDTFKGVNDTYGHQVGDQVLVQIARALTESSRPGDLIARLGGDEFVVVLDGVDEAAAGERAREMLGLVLGLPWDQVATGLRVGVSIGVAVGQRSDPQALMAQADAALYLAKSGGGSLVSLPSAAEPELPVDDARRVRPRVPNLGG